ncbi:growth-regulating factor 3-like [Neltuma alba]|uniref:growth-regulating factor 3-like n=1 Tax=Neltuma alba TaxID=207710 RepID=UPI0010A54638|nr:growth-regulating factor 3-like [Prosopis alba]
MRIRKNAKLCGGVASAGGSVLFGLDDNFQTHVCQLNQSPWDVIPFGSDSPLQFDGEEDSFTGNGSRGDSVGAVESVASMMDADDQTKPFPKIEDMAVVVHDNEAKVLEDIDEGRIADETTSFCLKTDGKNWHCKNEAKQGQSFCEHHLSLLRSYNNNNSVSYNHNNTSSSKKAAAAAAAAAVASAAGARRGKARAAKRASSSSSSSAASNPYEFYYYSGFGPLWGKRRGDRNGEGSNNHRSKNEQLKGVENSTITEAEEANEETTQNTSSPSRSSSSSQMDNEEFDYGMDDDEEDEEDEEEGANGDSGKKRMRKPVKARSLKSLM